MRVLVVGSCDQHGETFDIFRMACKELGAALAAAGHTILVGSDKIETADLYVVEGALSVDGEHRIVVRRPDDLRVPFSEHQKKHPDVRFVYRRSPGGWSPGRVYALLDADVAVAIGGGHGTAQTIYSAPALGKPVLALHWFKGAAAVAWDEFRGLYELAGVSLEDLESLEVWHPQSAATVLRAAGLLHANNPFRRPTVVPQLLGLTLILVVFAAWVGVFLKPDAFFGKKASVFVLLVLAAFLGSGLRATLRLLDEPTASFPIQRVVNELTVAVLLAFGLCLVYLAGGILLTGSFVTPTDDAFSRVGVTVSLLGVFSGVAVEEAAAKLRDWFRQTFAKP